MNPKINNNIVNNYKPDSRQSVQFLNTQNSFNYKTQNNLFSKNPNTIQEEEQHVNEKRSNFHQMISSLNDQTNEIAHLISKTSLKNTQFVKEQEEKNKNQLKQSNYLNKKENFADSVGEYEYSLKNPNQNQNNQIQSPNFLRPRVQSNLAYNYQSLNKSPNTSQVKFPKLPQRPRVLTQMDNTQTNLNNLKTLNSFGILSPNLTNAISFKQNVIPYQQTNKKYKNIPSQSNRESQQSIRQQKQNHYSSMDENDLNYYNYQLYNNGQAQSVRNKKQVSRLSTLEHGSIEIADKQRKYIKFNSKQANDKFKAQRSVSLQNQKSFRYKKRPQWNSDIHVDENLLNFDNSSKKKKKQKKHKISPIKDLNSIQLNQISIKKTHSSKYEPLQRPKLRPLQNRQSLENLYTISQNQYENYQYQEKAKNKKKHQKKLKKKLKKQIFFNSQNLDTQYMVEKYNKQVQMQNEHSNQLKEYSYFRKDNVVNDKQRDSFYQENNNDFTYTGGLQLAKTQKANNEMLFAQKSDEYYNNYFQVFGQLIQTQCQEQLRIQDGVYKKMVDEPELSKQQDLFGQFKEYFEMTLNKHDQIISHLKKQHQIGRQFYIPSNLNDIKDINILKIQQQQKQQQKKLEQQRQTQNQSVELNKEQNNPKKTLFYSVQQNQQSVESIQQSSSLSPSKSIYKNQNQIQEKVDGDEFENEYNQTFNEIKNKRQQQFNSAEILIDDNLIQQQYTK
ncbi:hypothetical protein PPERSA_11174 [Pseudocohnilembus persalinus]|uniref:Uncharacterized protein n=1 Tax=Pseudocohnilembus persalinus TaxID=266149 RepID=A0A0V0QZ58_PSEPJ|nr:hypothetical protein PPERSA_11174 [Pseudocohnilembus persalinus]|eukprot:KRX07625.1 hypothetical protein PPERSA_11174 [Pseudocohnilembus persalinus]